MKTYCLSILDQSCVLWSSGLTGENKSDLERTQHAFAKLVLQEYNRSYNEALIDLGLQSLENRRKTLTLGFAKRSLADGHFRDLFKKKKPSHTMETRQRDFYEVTNANTERLQKFANNNNTKITQ